MKRNDELWPIKHKKGGIVKEFIIERANCRLNVLIQSVDTKTSTGMRELGYDRMVSFNIKNVELLERGCGTREVLASPFFIKT